MINRTVLALSSVVAASLVSLAAAPAMASHLDSARDFVASIAPENNTWGTPCSLIYGESARTNGACFFTLSLRDDDPTITTTLLSTWWGSINPSAGVYYNQIGAGNHFTQILNVADIQEGDLLATSWTNTNGSAGGYVMIVDVAPALQAPSTTRYLVSILDSTTTPHGPSDSRWLADAGPVHDQGIGAGDIFIDADAVTGGVVSHTWSTVSGGTIYNQSGAGARPMRIGRFVR